jgi:acyl-CoA thioester hydrolase
MDRTLLHGWPVIVEQSLQWGEMDAFGHINNTVYFRYFENARLKYFLALGWGGQRPDGVGPILAATSARFKKPLEWPDAIAISARITEVGDDRFTMEHAILSEHWGGIVTEGTSLIVTFDYSANKKAPVPDDLRRAIAKLEGHAV